MRAIQARESLYGFYVLELLIHEHRMQHRLVETSLILISYNQHIIEVAGEIKRELVLRDILIATLVQLRLGIFLPLVFYLTRECHQRMNVSYIMLLAVFLNGKEIAHGMSPTAGNDHGLSPAFHAL